MRTAIATGLISILATIGSPSWADDGKIPEDWLTPAELSGFRSTPDYDETLEFVRRLERRWPAIRLEFFGNSAQGRPMPLIVVSNDRNLEPGTKSKRARLLIQNGIHSGEIDGKDASLMILRDMALGRHRELLDTIDLLIVPIYNVDGHERVSLYNRPNQDGPVEGMGFRTTADGHDLNRDHLKLSTPEARQLIGLFNEWRPHLHIDNHVTNGSDHAWVLTYSWLEGPQAPAAMDGWLQSEMPAVLAATEAAGHRIGPYVSLIDGDDPLKGIDTSVQEPRYATGYYPLRNVPSILVENHSHKPYRDRVLANRDFMLALFHRIAANPAALIRSVEASGERTAALGRADALPSEVVLRYRRAETEDTVSLPIYEWYSEASRVTGTPLLRYRRGKLRESEVPWFHRTEPDVSVSRPRGYLVLPGWPVIERRLEGHGLTFRRLTEGHELEVETIRISNPQQGSRSKPSYQGLTRISVDVRRQTETRTLPAGTIWIPADQPDFEVAVQLLEPEAPDSLVSWGLLSSVLESKEYIGSRGLEKIAVAMLEDPELAREWKLALEDETFAGDATARYDWWYRRTNYWDETVGLMPVMRLMTPPSF